MRRTKLRVGLAFFDVDTQHDFMVPTGALYVRGAQRIVGHIRKLVAFALKHGLPFFSSVDAHTLDDPELRDFQPHCIVGAPGQEKIPESLLPDRIVVPSQPLLTPNAIADVIEHDQIIFEKRTHNVFDNPNTKNVLRASCARRFVVFGVATDYSVRATVLGLRRLGYPVTVAEDAIRGVAHDSTEKALEEMRKAGALFHATARAVS